MTRKDYVLLASAIKKATEFCESSEYSLTSLKIAADSIAIELATDNPRFDKRRFLDACGVN